MIGSDGEFKFDELTATLRRLQKQVAAPVIELHRQTAGAARAISHNVRAARGMGHARDTPQEMTG